MLWISDPFHPEILCSVSLEAPSHKVIDLLIAVFMFISLTDILALTQVEVADSPISWSLYANDIDTSLFRYLRRIIVGPVSLMYELIAYFSMRTASHLLTNKEGYLFLISYFLS